MALILQNQSLALQAYAVLVGQQPGYTALNDHLAFISTQGIPAYSTQLNNIFLNTPTATLAATEPTLTLHPEDAASLGFADGDAVAVAVLDRFIHAVARVTPDVARGVAILPRLPQFAGLTATLGPCDLRRR